MISTSMTRRGFVKAAGVAAATLGLASTAHAESTAMTNSADDPEKSQAEEAATEFTLQDAVIDARYVPTSDGTAQLYTVVVKPAKEGKFPTVLIRNCYNVRTEGDPDIERFATYLPYLADGYVVVMQHTRGTGNSNGDFAFGTYDPVDAAATMAWLRDQEFYDGSIVRYGGSYLGMTSLVDAGEHYDDLKAIYAEVPIVPVYYCGNKTGSTLPR